MSDSDMRHIWRFLIETDQLGDGTWRAWSPSRAWSASGGTEQEAQDNAVDQAIERGESPDELVRCAPRNPIAFERDDPRVGWVWRFHPQTEEFSDAPGGHGSPAVGGR